MYASTIIRKLFRPWFSMHSTFKGGEFGKVIPGAGVPSADA